MRTISARQKSTLDRVTVDLGVEVTTLPISGAQLLELSTGMELEVSLPKSKQLALTCAGETIAMGRVCKKENRFFLKLTKVYIENRKSDGVVQGRNTYRARRAGGAE